MTDDREAIDSASMGQIMSLVLDAADPRRSANERDDGAEAAGAISETAAFVVAVGYLRAVLDDYDVKTLHARNDGMIREADAAIAVYDQRKTEGGTASAVRKLARLGLPIIHVNPENRMTTLRTSGQRAA